MTISNEALAEIERLAEAAKIALTTTMPVPTWIATMDAFRDALSPSVALAMRARIAAAEGERDRLRAVLQVAAKAVERMEADEVLYLKTCGMLVDLLEQESNDQSDERRQFIAAVRERLSAALTGEPP